MKDLAIVHRQNKYHLPNNLMTNIGGNNITADVSSRQQIHLISRICVMVT